MFTATGCAIKDPIFNTPHPEHYQPYELIGKTEAEARAFMVSVSENRISSTMQFPLAEEYDPGFPVNVIVRQDPYWSYTGVDNTPDHLVPYGIPFICWLNPMPSLLGLPEAAAQDLVGHARLHGSAARAAEHIPLYPAGTVLRQTPEPGSAVERGATVQYWVNPPAPQTGAQGPAPVVEAAMRAGADAAAFAVTADQACTLYAYVYPADAPLPTSDAFPGAVSAASAPDTAGATLTCAGLAPNTRYTGFVYGVNAAGVPSPARILRFTTQPSLSGDDTLLTVPDVVGWWPNAVLNGVEGGQPPFQGLAFRCAVEAQFDEQRTDGIILRQEPAAGSRVPEGTQVTFWVNRGGLPSDTRIRSYVRVPDLTALTEDLARQALADAGLAAGRVTVWTAHDPAYSAGVVLAQNPAEGNWLKKGSTVDFVLNPPAQTKVPSLLGLTEAEALELLTRTYLKRGMEGDAPLADAHDPAYAPGQVVWQSPGAGTEMEPGGSVQYKLNPTPAPTVTATVAVGIDHAVFTAKASEHCTLHAYVYPGGTGTPTSYTFANALAHAEAQSSLEATLLCAGLAPGTAYVGFVYGVNAQGACSAIQALPFTTLPAPTPAPIRVVDDTPPPIAVPDRRATVPDLTGMTQAEAEQALAEAGFTGQATILETGDASQGPGQVVRQEPAAGAERPLGATVFYYLNPPVPDAGT